MMTPIISTETVQQQSSSKDAPTVRSGMFVSQDEQQDTDMVQVQDAHEKNDEVNPQATSREVVQTYAGAPNASADQGNRELGNEDATAAADQHNQYGSDAPSDELMDDADDHLGTPDDPGMGTTSLPISEAGSVGETSAIGEASAEAETPAEAELGLPVTPSHRNQHIKEEKELGSSGHSITGSRNSSIKASASAPATPNTAFDMATGLQAQIAEKKAEISTIKNSMKPWFQACKAARARTEASLEDFTLSRDALLAETTSRMDKLAAEKTTRELELKASYDADLAVIRNTSKRARAIVKAEGDAAVEAMCKRHKTSHHPLARELERCEQEIKIAMMRRDKCLERLGCYQASLRGFREDRAEGTEEDPITL